MTNTFLCLILSWIGLIQSQKVNIGIYVESCCYYCQQFIVYQLQPAWYNPGFMNITNILFSPFGNEEYSYNNGSYNFRCQHGSNECLGNRIESCVIALYPDPLIYIPYMINLETTLLVYDDYCSDPTKYAHETAIELKLDWNAITNCYRDNITAGDNAVLAQAKKTENLNPPIQWNPWITINDVPTVSFSL